MQANKTDGKDSNAWLEISGPFDLDSVSQLQQERKLLQTQLLTGRHKPRAWYYDPSGDRSFPYVLKAPLTDDNIRQLVKSDIIKRLFGLIPIVKEILSNGIIFYNYVPVDISSIEIKTSKIETNVAVYTGDHAFLDINSLDSTGALELMKILAFRKVIGTNDTCNRNIIQYGDKIYSIDDPFLNKTTPLMFKSPVPARQIGWYKQQFEKMRGVINYTLGEWRRLVSEMSTSEWISAEDKRFMLARIAELCDNDWSF